MAESMEIECKEPKTSSPTKRMQELPPHTETEADIFDLPVEQIKVSGGTAAFYALRLRDEAARRWGSERYFIGKDIWHAADEVEFYEEARAILVEDPTGPLARLVNFMFEYIGVVSPPGQLNEKGNPLQLLVMRNLRDGCRGFRMLDVKIGQKTAAPNWKGKSKYRALRQDLVDQMTNSMEEGFRLEGIDGSAPALQSIERICCRSTESKKGKKPNFRLFLQQMHCADVLMHFLDVHAGPSDPGEAALGIVLSPSELAEAVLREVVRRLVLLAIACRQAPAPQKWVGSSVALCFDSGHLPPRTASENDIRTSTKVQVKIFDWGRSELNTPGKFADTDDKKRADYERFWGYYIQGIDRLAWEAARAYRHRFGNVGDWREALITIVDFDAHSGGQVLGQVRISPIKATGETTATIMARNGKPLYSRALMGKVSTLTYSIEYRTYPVGSRFKAAWRIHVIRASDLPRTLKGAPDTFAEIVASSESQDCMEAVKSGQVHAFRQVTAVQPATQLPEWRETVELPLAAAPGLLDNVVGSAAPTVADDAWVPLASILPREEVVIQAQHEARRLPEGYVSVVAGGSTSSPSDAGLHTANGSGRAGNKASVISLGQDAFDDEASIQEWQVRLDRAAVRSTPSASSANQSGNSTGYPVRQKVGKAEALRLVQQTGVKMRILAMIGIFASFVATGLLSVVLIRDRWFDRIGWPQNATVVSVVVIQPFLGLTTCMFETSRRQVGSICCCGGYADALSRYCLFHRLGRRGCVYLLQAALWFVCEFILMRWWYTANVNAHASSGDRIGYIIMGYVAFVGILLCVVGLLLLLSSFGAVSVARGVIRRVPAGLGRSQPTAASADGTPLQSVPQPPATSATEAPLEEERVPKDTRGSPLLGATRMKVPLLPAVHATASLRTPRKSTPMRSQDGEVVEMRNISTPDLGTQ